MYTSNTTQPLSNPAKHFYEFKNGGFQYYDKLTKETVKVALPLKFIVLDHLATLKGYCRPDQSGYWSNEVRDLTTDTLTVRTKKGVVTEGLYINIKSECRDAKYTQSIYILTKEAGNFILANLQLNGAAVGAWLDFEMGNNIKEGGVVVKEMIQKVFKGEQGETIYQVPVFEKIDIQTETHSLAVEKNKELQTYLAGYFKHQNIA